MKYIGGVDTASKGVLFVACVAVFSYPELKLIEETFAFQKIKFPYIPTFLAFREMPVILAAYKKLKTKPDILLVDGQGISHPRFCGIATHLGVQLNKATIGCAKSPLFGNYSMPSPEKGNWTPIEYNGRILGIVLRTRTNIKPLFVSPGNLVNLDDCIKYVIGATKNFRIPEPIRYTHRRVNENLVESALIKEARCLR